MEQQKIDRINFLAKKSKTPEGLTDAERAEQHALRQEYLAGFRRNLHAQLDNIYLVDENGNSCERFSCYDAWRGSVRSQQERC